MAQDDLVLELSRLRAALVEERRRWTLDASNVAKELATNVAVIQRDIDAIDRAIADEKKVTPRRRSKS
jgi:hypothetical protein